MQAGKLNRWISIEERTSTQDGTGQPGDTWTPVLSCRARLAALTGREVYAVGAGFQGQLSHKVTIRYTSATITPGMRVHYGAKTFLIQLPPANQDEANKQLDLMCLEQS